MAESQKFQLKHLHIGTKVNKHIKMSKHDFNTVECAHQFASGFDRFVASVFLHRISRGVNYEAGLPSPALESSDCQHCDLSECIVHCWGDCTDLAMRGTSIDRIFA
jgi:hypothetical protein